jgi:dolichol-phosphate mannosyltransferase
MELIFVNDGSRDTSLEELVKIKRARPATKIVNLSRNFGAVAASKTGFNYVTGNAFTILAADLQDPPIQIFYMVEHWLKGNKFVVSARAKRKDPPLTSLFSWLFYRILKLVIARDYPTGGFDMMLMDEVMLPYMKTSAKSTNPSLYAYWLGFKPVVLLYERQRRQFGRSRWTWFKKLQFFADTVSGFSVTPIRLLSLFGVFIAILSFAYGFVIASSAIFGNVQVPGFVTLAVLISFFGGMILMTLGVVGEYLWRVFEAVSGKPEAVVADVLLENEEIEQPLRSEQG